MLATTCNRCGGRMDRDSAPHVARRQGFVEWACLRCGAREYEELGAGASATRANRADIEEMVRRAFGEGYSGHGKAVAGTRNGRRRKGGERA